MGTLHRRRDAPFEDDGATSTENGDGPTEVLVIQPGCLDFVVALTYEDGAAVVNLRGELDIDTVAEVRPRLLAAWETKRQTVIVDLHAVTFVDCAALTILRILEADVVAQGGKVVWRSPSPWFSKVTELAGLAQSFGIVTDGRESSPF